MLLRIFSPRENTEGPQANRGLLRILSPRENPEGPQAYRSVRAAYRGDYRLLDIMKDRAQWRATRLLYRREFAHIRFVDWLHGVLRRAAAAPCKWNRWQYVALLKALLPRPKLLFWASLIVGLLLLIAGIEPNPGPRRQKPPRNRNKLNANLRVVNWNAASLNSRSLRENVCQRLREAKADALLIQETRISPPDNDPEAAQRGFFTIEEDEEYTLFCTLPDDSGATAKYGCGIMLSKELRRKVCSISSDSARYLEVTLNFGSGETLKLAAIYAVQDNCRPESLRGEFWSNVSKGLQDKQGARKMATIAGIDANGRIATPDGRNVGNHLLHQQETKNGSSLKRLIQDCDLQALNTLRHDNNDGAGVETYINNGRSGQRKSQIDFILSSHDFRAHDVRIIQDWVDVNQSNRHLPIMATLDVGRRAQRGSREASSGRSVNPMRLNYCASALRSARKAAAAGDADAQSQLNALRANVAHVRDSWAESSWNGLWETMEEVIAMHFPRTKRLPAVHSSTVSVRTAQLKEQIQEATENLLDCNRHSVRLTMEQCFLQWKQRHQLTANAESRWINGKKQVKKTFLPANSQNPSYGWSYENDLKLVPIEDNHLLQNRAALLKQGRICKETRAQLRRDLTKAQGRDHFAHVEEMALAVEQQPSLVERSNKAWDMVNTLRDNSGGHSRKNKTQPIRAADGTTKSTPEGKAEAFAQHVTANFSEPNPADRLSDEQWEAMQERPSGEIPQMATSHSISKETRAALEQEITAVEIAKAFKELKPNKAIGLDHICSEVFLLDPDGWGKWLQPRFRDMDPATQTGRVIWLYKNKGSTADPNNYRPISILSPVYKVWTKVMTWKCDRIIRDVASSWQFGFRKERGTREALYAAQLLLNKDKSEGLSLAMLDLSKAFDRCNRKLLFQKMLELGAPKELVSQLRQGHGATKLRACFDGAVADPVEVQKGVYQGSPLSPALYLIYAHCMYNDYAQECEQAGIQGINVSDEADNLPQPLLPTENQIPRQCDKKLHMLCYADDTNLVGRSMEELAKCLEAYNKVATRYHMSVNGSKTKILTRVRLSTAEKLDWAAKNLGLEKPEEALGTFTENASFLGSLINVRGYTHQACIARANEGRKIFRALERSFFRVEQISMETKLRVYSAIFPAVTLYGLDAYACSEHDVAELQSLQNMFLRAIFEGKWVDFQSEEEKIQFFRNRTSNLAIQKQLRVASVKSLLARARLRFIETLNLEGRSMNGATILHKYQLRQGEDDSEGDDPQEPAFKRRKLPDYINTVEKRLGTIVRQLNDRFLQIRGYIQQRKDELDGEFSLLDSRWPSELTKAQVAKRKAGRKQVWKEETMSALLEEHDCTRSCAKSFENLLSDPLGNVESVNYDTPRILGTTKWKALTNWMLTTRAGAAAQESEQKKTNCLCCGEEFIDVAKHLMREAKKRQASAAPHDDCLQHYCDNLCPLVPQEGQDNQAEEDPNWKDHPGRFRCPMRMKSCHFPREKLRWCVVCRNRENFIPNANKAEQKCGRKRNRVAREVKKATGKAYVPHNGKVDLSCPKKLKRCCYPDEVAGWWCTSCVGRTGHKPEANKQKEELARARRQQKREALQQQQQQLQQPAGAAEAPRQQPAGAVEAPAGQFH